MKTFLIVLALLPSLLWAETIEVFPDPPAGIPMTAGRIVQCVGIDDNGVAYCNVTYGWKVRRNRFCCSYYRKLTAIVAGSQHRTPIQWRRRYRLPPSRHPWRSVPSFYCRRFAFIGVCRLVIITKFDNPPFATIPVCESEMPIVERDDNP